MEKMFFKSKIAGLLLLAAVLFSLSFSTKTMAEVNYTLIHVDEFDNEILPMEIGSVPDIQWKSLNARVIASLYNAGREYELKRIQNHIPSTHFLFDASGPKILLEGGVNVPRYKLVYALRQSGGDNTVGGHTPSDVHTPSTPNPPGTDANAVNFRVEFVDEAGNKLIPDLTGSLPANTWLKLQREFKATLHDPGAKYMIRDKQAYDASRFIYGLETKVFITKSFDHYRIVCYKKEESDTIPRSTRGGGGDSGGGRAPLRVKEGWILEGEENWTYYSGTSRSNLKKGWHKDPQDGFWYYLDPNTGKMYTGWHLIEGKWYFFNEYTPIWTWEKRNDGEWYFKRIASSRPYGSMYRGETTPDEFRVGEDGSRTGEEAKR